MKTSAWWNSDYIVNLTTTVVGKKVLESLRFNEQANGRALYLFLGPMVRPKVMVMSDETLGRICAYGNKEGIHRGASIVGVDFINKTGFNDLGCGLYSGSGRQILEKMAKDTILCIARDIILQPDYKLQQEQDEREAHELERAEHAMEHDSPHITSLEGYMGGQD